jgi:diacylglycerol kinase family enzyme
MPGKNALLVLNSKSREGESDLSAALGYLEEQGYRFVDRVEAASPDLPEQVRRSAANTDLIIAGGGDGTMRGLAQVLAETKLPLGILPLGTANDLARTLKIAPDPLKASRVIAENRLHRIDVG